MRSLFLFTSRIEMCSFGQARDLSIICYNNGDLTAEELLIFIEEHTSRNPEFSYDLTFSTCKSVNARPVSDLIKMIYCCCQKHFSYLKQSVATKGPLLVKWKHCLCIWSVLPTLVAMPTWFLFLFDQYWKLTNIDNILDNHKHRIAEWNHQVLNPINLERYADVIHQRGAALTNCFGFIDGTGRPICI